MDLSQLLPILMLMQGGKAQNLDMLTLLSSVMGANAQPQKPQSKKAEGKGAPLNMDMSKLQGMLSPEMLKILSSLGRKF